MTEEYYVPGSPEPAYEPQAQAAPEPEPAYEPQAPQAEASARVLVEPEADPEPYSNPAHSPATPHEGAQADWGEADAEPRRGIGAKALAAIVLVAAIAIGGLAGAFYAKSNASDDASQPTAEPAAAQSGATGSDFAFAIAAEGWDAESSTPFIVLARGTAADGTVVDTARAFTTGDFTWSLAYGTYTFTLVPPVNADGSTYASADLTCRDGSCFTSAVLDRIQAGSVTQKQALAILNSVERAMGAGDETVSGDAGRAIYELAERYLPETAAAAAGTSSTATADGHEHDWELDTVDGDPIYVDGAPIYGSGEPVYEYHDVCSCGVDCTAAGLQPSYHKATHGSDAYQITKVSVITGYEQIVTGYERKLAGYEQVPVGYTCKKCGEEKELEE